MKIGETGADYINTSLEVKSMLPTTVHSLCSRQSNVLKNATRFISTCYLKMFTLSLVIRLKNKLVALVRMILACLSTL